jgi:probable phosphoglycerate mutase
MSERSSDGTIYLVRHGRTALNAGGRFRGREDVPLDEIGLGEVEATGDRLHAHLAAGPAPVPERILMSPLARTRTTAHAIASRFGLEPIADERLLDLDYGAWTAMTPEEAEALDPQAFRTFRTDPYRAHTPRGERVIDVARRIEHARDEIAASLGGGCAVFVTHDIPIQLLLGRSSDPPTDPWGFDVPTASITELAVVERSATERSVTPVRIGWKD